MKQKSSYIMIAAAATGWGLTGLCNRMLTDASLSQFQILFVRCFVTLVLTAIVLAIIDRDAFKIKLKDIWIFLGLAILSILMFGYSYFSCMQETSLSVAVVLLYTSPIFVMLFSAPLFHERITHNKLIALVLVLAGAICATGLLSGGLVVTPKGIVFGLLAGLGYGLYSIFSRFALNRGYSSQTITLYTFFLGSIVVGLFTDIPGIFTKTTTLSIGVWEFLMGLITCFGPYMLYTRGLQNVENGTASILASLEIVVTTLVSAVILGEAFGFGNVIGIVLVLGGIIVMNVGRSSDNSQGECNQQTPTLGTGEHNAAAG